MRRLFGLFIALGLGLSACGTLEISLATPPAEITEIPVGSAPEATAEPRLSLNSSSEEIQHFMLESARQWKSIWMDGTVTYFAMGGTDSQTATVREQAWIDLPRSRFRILAGPAGDAPETFKVSDGATVLEVDLKTGQSQSYPLPDLGSEKQFVPPLQPGFAYPQPLWGQIGTSLSQLAFPSDFAQSEGTFKPIAIESVAGREALAVEWTYVQNQLPSWRMWLDTETAVILKMQSFDKEGGETIRSEALVNHVSYDDVFADPLFRAPVSLPQFGDMSGVSNAPEPNAAAPTGRDALGELYFFVLPHQAGQTAQLDRLPGMCVVGLAPCPAPEAVTPPFPFNFSLTPLTWSRDGNFAAFAYPDNPEGTPYKLWLFDPASNTWTSLFEYAYIDAPFWSPDGNWIAFRVQDGLGGEDVYAVQRDGTGLKNLTSSSNLPEGGRPYVMDGWITGNLIVRSGKPGNEGTVYLIRVADGHVQPMFEALLTKAVFNPSSDGAWLVYDDYNYEGQNHTLFVTEPDGANPVKLANFRGGSLYPIVWSSDSRHVAFAYHTDATQGNPTADVYVIKRDGTGSQQVYHGVTVGSLMFSPDRKYLLVNETTSPTGGHLFVVELETQQQRIIQAPGLSLDSDWYMPSWRR
jgi:hypothetical protein